MVPLESLTLNSFRDLVFTRGAEGLLVLLPESFDSLSQGVITAWTDLERELLHLEVHVSTLLSGVFILQCSL